MNKRLGRFLLPVLLAGAMLFSSGCKANNDDTPDGMKLASPAGVDYQLYVPEKWKVDSSEGSILTAAHVEDGDNSNVTVMTHTNDGEITKIADYWSNYKATLIRYFDTDGEGNTSFKLLPSDNADAEDGEVGADGEKATLDGQTCGVYRYEGLVAGIPLRYMQVITYYNGDFYIFTYTATTENDRYDRNEEDVAKMLIEFRFKK